ncbi:hypothetical protein [Micromonospora fluostatini]|uniref:hypothetical protein n=1 Tax=Micromonospora sp. JCM 30529 TaxID=3421643 RepID=UPI003D16D30C
MIGDSDHVAAGPAWRCPTDGDPWPCPPFRALPATEQVARLLTVYAHQAVRDLRHAADPVEPTDTVRRFLGDLSDADAKRVALRLLRTRQPIADPPPTYPHRPMRPLWRCSACRLPWPCEPARRGLLAAYPGRRDALLRHLVSLKVEAQTTLTRLGSPPTPAQLDERFVAWARAHDPAES